MRKLKGNQSLTHFVDYVGPVVSSFELGVPVRTGSQTSFLKDFSFFIKPPLQILLPPSFFLYDYILSIMYCNIKPCY